MNINLGGFSFGAGVGYSSGTGQGGAGVGYSSGTGQDRGGGCDSIVGVIIGLILIPLGFYLPYDADRVLVNHGKIFESVEMMSPEAARAAEGELVKISGWPTGQFLSLPEWEGQALYYRTEIEEYQEETDSDGEVSYDWNTTDTTSEWADFSIDGIQIRTEDAKPVGEQEVYTAYKKRYETAFHVGTSQENPEVGDQRKTIEVLDAGRPVIVLGEMSNGTIQGGRSFVISTLNEAETVRTLETEYAIAKWALRGAAVLAIGIGILMVFGPLTWLVGHVPFVGEQVSCVFAIFAFVFALVSVGLITLFIKAFWIILVVTVLLLAFAIYRGVTTPRQKPGAAVPTGEIPTAPSVAPTSVPGPEVPKPVDAPGVPTPATAPPETPSQPEAEQPQESPKFCIACGAQLKPGTRFCPQYGHRVGES